MTSHTGLWDACITWYSPCVTNRIYICVGLAEVGSISWGRIGGAYGVTSTGLWAKTTNTCVLLLDRHLRIFYMCAVCPYLHSTCVCVQICIFISRQCYFIETSPNDILPLPYTLWLGIYGFRPTWHWLIIKVHKTQAKYFKLSGYSTVINCTITFCTTNVFGCFSCVMAHLDFVKHKFLNQTD